MNITNIPPDGDCDYPNKDRKQVKKNLTRSEEEQMLAEKLLDAVHDKHYGLCQVLLVLRARGDVLCGDRGGMAALHVAVGLEPVGDALDFLTLLLQYGANPNVRATCGGITPVHLSAILEKPKAMKLLLASGGDPDILDHDEKSAFHHGWESEKVRRVLKKYLSEQKQSASSDSDSSSNSEEQDLLHTPFSSVKLKRQHRHPLMNLDSQLVGKAMGGKSCSQARQLNTQLENVSGASSDSHHHAMPFGDKSCKDCALCASLKKKRHFEKMMMKSMGVHFSKYYSTKSPSDQTDEPRENIVARCERCFCSDKRMNFSYPMDGKLKLWYECHAGKENIMKNLVKSLPAVSPANLLKNKRRSIKHETFKTEQREGSSSQQGSDECLKKSEMSSFSSGSDGEQASSGTESLSSQKSNSGSTASSIESAQNLLNMQITESDLDKISLLDGEAVHLKPSAYLDVSSPNNPVIASKEFPSKEPSCTCKCSGHRRNSELEQTVAVSRRSLSLSNEKLQKSVNSENNSILLNNQATKSRKSFSNSPFLFWKKKNNLEAEKDLLNTPVESYQNVSLNNSQASRNLFSNQMCVAHATVNNTAQSSLADKSKSIKNRTSQPRFSYDSPNRNSPEPMSDSELWDTINSENKNSAPQITAKYQKSKSCKRQKLNSIHQSSKCHEFGSKVNSNSSQNANISIVRGGESMFRDEFTNGFRTGLEKISRHHNLTRSSATSKRTCYSGRRVTFSDHTCSFPSNSNSSDDNNLSADSKENLGVPSENSSRRSNISQRISPAKFYKSIFKRSEGKRLSNVSKVSSELIQEGDLIFEQVFIKPKSDESLLTNDLSDHSLNTSFVTCAADWKSCRTASTRDESSRNTTEKFSQKDQAQARVDRNCNSSKFSGIPNEEQDSIRVTENLSQLSNAEIFQRLRDVNCSTYGPVTDTTRSLYLKILAGFQAKMDGSFEKVSIESQKEIVLSKQTEFATNPNDFPRLLSDYLNGGDSVTLLPELEGEEELMTSVFRDPNRTWREGGRKKSFTYLLLDPRVTKNLQSRSRNLTELESFRYFVSAIFYVGKGQANRPLSHFNEAVRPQKNTSTQVSEKVNHIKDIWESGFGVVNLQCYQNTIPAEAYTREALMISTLGLNRLTNQRKGDFYGVCPTWDESRKQQLGLYLLKKAMRIFLQDGERQIKLADF